MASPPARLTARPAPVSGPPRPLCTCPPPQHRLSPAYTPAALGELKPPPPDEIIRDKQELKTRWLVEGWYRAPSTLTQSIASSLASGQLVLPVLPLAQLADPEGAEPATFEYRARLLGLY